MATQTASNGDEGRVVNTDQPVNTVGQTGLPAEIEVEGGPANQPGSQPATPPAAPPQTLNTDELDQLFAQGGPGVTEVGQGQQPGQRRGVTLAKQRRWFGDDPIGSVVSLVGRVIFGSRAK